MSDDVVVKVEGLSKRFRIYSTPWDRAREWVSLRRRSYHTDFWALRDVSFELRRGESLGVIGQNGAGKSTLLKILNGGLFATSGSFSIKGRVLSILELGTGFNNDLTGRQNVFYSANLLGFPEDYVAKHIDAIEDFAELGDFFERPLQMYSTGMRARLAFSMFAFLECDILILDEVLAVGDIFFTQKCYARMEELRARNTAMLIVTHNISVIHQYCQKAILIDKGELVYSGTPSEAGKRYFFLLNPQSRPPVRPRPAQPAAPAASDNTTQPAIRWPVPAAFYTPSEKQTIGDGWARCTGIALCDDDGNPCQTFQSGQRAHWYYEFEALEDMAAPNGHVLITDDKNVRLHGKNTVLLGVRPEQPLLKGMRVRFHQIVTLLLTPGEYGYSVGLSASPIDATGDDARRGFPACDIERAGSFTVIGVPRHLGLVDLPGDCEVELCSSTYHPIPDLATHGPGI